MFIDAVYSGGGIRGYALIGAQQALEENGFRMRRVAGTSAGSIIASFVAAGYSGKEIEEIMMDVTADDLLDKEFGTTWPFFRWMLLYWTMGLYKGKKLETWVDGILKQKGIRTFGDLPEQKTLRIVASDITSGTIAVFPDDLPKYGINPATFPIARAIRMSCSIPYFFRPVKIKHRKFVDGGVLSNFPMWLFDTDHVKKDRPVIGLKLNPDKLPLPQNEIDNAVTLFTALFDTMRNGHDNRYISRKHVKDIVFIPVPKEVALDFNLSKEKKEELIDTGRRSAETFLKKWI